MLSLGAGDAAAHSKKFSPRADIQSITLAPIMLSGQHAEAAGPSVAQEAVLAVEGQVKSRKGKCKKGRRVELQVIDGAQARESSGTSTNVSSRPGIASPDLGLTLLTVRTASDGSFDATFLLGVESFIATTSGIVAEYTASAAIEPRKFGHGKQHRCGGHEDQLQAG